MNFFPDVSPAADGDATEELPEQAWMGAPNDVLPGVVPVELIIGLSESAVVMLPSIRAYPAGLSISIGVRVRGPMHRTDLHSEILSPYTRDLDAEWQATRLKWGFELPDGARVTNLDPRPWSPHSDQLNPTPEPDGPVLTAKRAGGGPRSVNLDYWLWPLPRSGPIRVACQWLAEDIQMSFVELQTQPLLDAAARARSIWPEN
jgi:hypothetical protein